MNSENKKLTTGAFTWCWICFLANCIFAFFMLYYILNFNKLGNISVYDYIITFSITTSAAGYAVLIAGKKVGFYIICGATTLYIIFNIVGMVFLYIACSLLIFLITWLSIRKNWKSWNELDNNIKIISFLIELILRGIIIVPIYFILRFTLFKFTIFTKAPLVYLVTFGVVLVSDIMYKLINKKIG